MVTTGSMNYVYIWQRRIKQEDTRQEEVNEINSIQVMEPTHMSYLPPFPTVGTSDPFQSSGFGWGAFPSAHDFPNLSSVVIFDSDDEEDQKPTVVQNQITQVEDDDEIIVYM